MKPVKDEGGIVIHLNSGVWLHACPRPHIIMYNFMDITWAA